MSEENTRRRTLVMFSGGKDSFITACRCAIEGDFVGLVSFDNGCLRYEQHLAHGATRIINRFGSENVKFEGVYSIGGIIWGLQKWYVNQPLFRLVKELPDVPPAQITCLHCQTAMWIAAIAFAKAREYDRICAGYLNDDVFCTGCITWTIAMRMMANVNGIDVEFPVWFDPDKEEPWKFARDKEMASLCFVPKVLEPQCMIGMPAPIAARDMESQLRRYHESHLKEFALNEIDDLINTMRFLNLRVPEAKDLDWKVPDPSTGEF